MMNRYTVEIAASPEQVFHWLDDPKRVMEWLPNLAENENLEETENKIGTTFRQVYDERGRRMEMHGVVTAYDANRRFACQISGDAFDLDVDYQLEDLGGRTRLTQHSRVRFKGFLKIIAPIMSPFIKKSSMEHLKDSFGKLKLLAESDGEADDQQAAT